jgi:hypothetical protein
MFKETIQSDFDLNVMVVKVMLLTFLLYFALEFSVRVQINMPLITKIILNSKLIWIKTCTS